MENKIHSKCIALKLNRQTHSTQHTWFSFLSVEHLSACHLPDWSNNFWSRAVAKSNRIDWIDVASVSIWECVWEIYLDLKKWYGILAGWLLCNCSATYIWMLIIKFHQKCNKNSISLVVICCFWFGFGFCELNLFGSALVSSFISSSSSSSSHHKSTRKTRIFLQIYAHYVLKVKFENRKWRKKISSREALRALRKVFNRIQYGTQTVLC